MRGINSPSFKNLAGKKFNKLLVINLKCFSKRVAIWNCLCECGNKTTSSSARLNNGKKKSCGCLYKTINLIDLTGKRFGLYTVIKRIFKIGKNKSEGLWECICDCGKINYIRGYTLKSGVSTKCRKCRGKEMIGKNNPNWNNFISKEEKELNQNRRYKSSELKTWRKLVYERDNYTCQVTGKISKGDICAHHLESWNKNKELRFILTNGITILKSVHNFFHKKYGKGNNTKKQFEEFVKNLSKEDIRKLIKENE